MRDTAHTFKKRTFQQKICIGIGIVFIFLGAVGLLYPGFAGGHFTLTMNFLHITSGLLAFVAGTANRRIYAYYFCIAGVIFTGSLALAGFTLGETGTPSIGFQGEDPLHFVIIPKIIELGIVDHVVNLALTVVFIIGICNYRTHTHRHVIKVSTKPGVKV